MLFNMIHCRRLIPVMPAYNAASTVEQTVANIPSDHVDEMILVHDFSRDQTPVTGRFHAMCWRSRTATILSLNNEMLAQAHFFGFRLGEVSCPTRYEPESSCISFRRSIEYDFGVRQT